MNADFTQPPISAEQQRAFEKLKRSAQQLCNQLREKIYAGFPKVPRASLVIEITNGLRIQMDPTGGHPGYDSAEDRILLRIAAHNIDDPRVKLLQPSRWPQWQAALLEEIVHEYQHKITGSKATSQGCRLFEEFSRKFDESPGHDETFFTAVDEVALLIGLTPEQLLRGIE